MIISSSRGVYRLLELCLRGRNFGAVTTFSNRRTLSLGGDCTPSLVLLSVVLPGFSN